MHVDLGTLFSNGSAYAEVSIKTHQWRLDSREMGSEQAAPPSRCNARHLVVHYLVTAVACQEITNWLKLVSLASAWFRTSFQWSIICFSIIQGTRLLSSQAGMWFDDLPGWTYTSLRLICSLIVAMGITVCRKLIIFSRMHWMCWSDAGFRWGGL